MKEVNFLDVTLDLRSGLYKPYNKPNDTPLYVHKNSNNPPSILKNLPAGINKRLSSLSANEEIFKQATPTFQEALQNKLGLSCAKLRPASQLSLGNFTTL